jgi:L-2-hydroxyglutarate oxidase LhgO
MKNEKNFDYVIIGSGIIGLSIARELTYRTPRSKILILEKESTIGAHSSGRNSGVLHTGFYYPTDSLKAKFTSQGNKEMTAYCHHNKLKVNPCGKVVVTTCETEIPTLHELAKRGIANASGITLIDDKELKEIEPNAKTISEALFSPHTATINPKQILNCIVKELTAKSVQINFNEGYKARIVPNFIVTTKGNIVSAGTIINAAGLYADKIAQDFGYANKYTILPFKGIYLKHSGAIPPLKTNIYPVPNASLPFLGVHFTVTVDNAVKIGPTAIPAFWRENYQGLKNFNLKEAVSILGWESKLFLKNSFNFRTLALEEFKRYHKKYLLSLANSLVYNLNPSKFNLWTTPGIRAQLLNKETLGLVNDFIVEGDNESVHILNAVSPGFTCSFPFARFVVDRYVNT